jgi:hypothetical protein
MEMWRLILLWFWSIWPDLSSELPRTPLQVVLELWFGLMGESGPSIESTTKCGYHTWGEIVEFQVWVVKFHFDYE